jgi:hypothetical protein
MKLMLKSTKLMLKSIARASSCSKIPPRQIKLYQGMSFSKADGYRTHCTIAVTLLIYAHVTHIKHFFPFRSNQSINP